VIAFMLESTSAGLLGVGLGQQFPDLRHVEIEQRREHAGIADVLHQDARAHTVEFSLHIFASGTPSTVMSSRASSAGRGHVES
jgi:hypothetical protein